MFLMLAVIRIQTASIFLNWNGQIGMRTGSIRNRHGFTPTSKEAPMGNGSGTSISTIPKAKTGGIWES